MPLQLIPDDIIEHYRLREKAIGGYVYMEIRKGMYGLPQAGILANKLFKLHLAHHGYFEQSHMPGLRKHTSRPIWFKLYVDDFGIKYMVTNTSSTSLLPFGQKHMKLLKIGRAISIAVSLLHGTTIKDLLT
jgi:hypothetical protein